MKKASVFLLTLIVLLLAASPVFAASPVGRGELFYNGTVVRTLVPPATMAKEGKDNLYAVMGGAEGQLPIAGVAPGDKDYHGGKWAFHSVTWNTDPYLLTSESAVEEAAAAGDVTITRNPANDFKCPIQP